MTKTRFDHAAAGLVGLALAFAFGAGIASAQTAPKPVGFVSAVKGLPVLATDDGKRSLLGALKTLPAGSAIIVQKGDQIDICHEATAKTFRVEGTDTGTVAVTQTGLSPSAGVGLTETGKCGKSAPASVPGGVLLRGIAPPKN